MKIGEIVEKLIIVKGDYAFEDFRNEAIEEACNVLSRLPRMADASTYDPCEEGGLSE